MADDDKPRQAPGAAAFYWMALAAMIIIPILLMAMAAE